MEEAPHSRGFLMLDDRTPELAPALYPARAAEQDGLMVRPALIAVLLAIGGAVLSTGSIPVARFH
jgi:hypothetical protein